MTAPLFSPAMTFMLIAIAVLLGYVFGASRLTQRHEDMVAWTVGENRRLASALRNLYKLADVPYPTDEEDPEPAPSRWQRLRAWLRDQRRDEPLGTPATEEKAAIAEEESLPAEDVAPDPAPVTEPIPATGPATVPSQVVTGRGLEQILREHEEHMAIMRADALESIRQMAEEAK